MTDATPVFRAQFSAEDDGVGALIGKLKLGLTEVKTAAQHASHELGHMHHESVWARLHESVGEAKEHFTELGEHVAGVGEKLTELIPALSALGTVGGAVALFETAEKTAEAYGELAHTAQSLGMQAQQLHVWNAVATLTDTNAEAMAKSMSKLNRVLFEAASGKNKEALSLFHHMHLDPKNYRDAAEALPALANAFHNTAFATTRAAMAHTLFGKAGDAMTPVLMQGRKAVEEHLERAKKLTFDFGPYGKGLEEYNESMKELRISSQAFVDEVGAKLTPVLKPVVDEMTDWVTANRDWVSTKITDEVRDLAGWVKAIDWKYVGQEIKGWASSAHDFSDEIGGAKTAVELLTGAIALNAAVSFVGKVGEIATISRGISSVAVKLTAELVPAWIAVGAAATEAATAEELALGKAAVARGVWAGIGIAGVLAVGGYEAEKSRRQESLGFGKGRGMTDDQAAKNYVDSQIGFGGGLAAPFHGEVIPDTPDSGPVHGGWGGDIYNWMAKHAYGDSTEPNNGGTWLSAIDRLGWSDDDPPTDRSSLVPTGPAAMSPGLPSVSLSPAPESRGVQAPGKGEMVVTLNVNGLPSGSTATATVTGSTVKPTVQLGQAWGDHLPR